VSDAPRCPYPTEIVTERIGRYTVTAELPSTPEGKAAMLAPAIPIIGELLRQYDRRMAAEAAMKRAVKEQVA
jgi:hypothetical protein